MTPDEKTVHDKCIEDIEKGIKNYGLYTYYDKGAWEVVDMCSLEKDLKALGPESAARVLMQVRNHEHGPKFVQEMVCMLDEWIEFEKMLESETELADMY